MSGVHFVKARFEGMRECVPLRGKPVCRIRASGRVLYSRTPPGYWAAIPEGRSLFMGVRVHNDGTFWLHWAFSPEWGTVADMLQTWKLPMACLALVLGGICCFSFGWLVSIGADMAEGGMDGLRASGMEFFDFLYFLLLFAEQFIVLPMAAFFLFTGAELAWTEFTPRRRRLRRFLRKARHFEFEGCRDLADLEIPEKKKGQSLAADAWGSSITVAEGRVFALTATRDGRKRRYSFICAGEGEAVGIDRVFNLRVRDATPDIRKNDHPLALAEGDVVRVVYSLAEDRVIALLNREDGCAYYFSGNIAKDGTNWFLPRPARLVFLGLPLLVFWLPGSAAASPVLRASFTLGAFWLIRHLFGWVAADEPSFRDTEEMERAARHLEVAPSMLNDV